MTKTKKEGRFIPFHHAGKRLPLVKFQGGHTLFGERNITPLAKRGTEAGYKQPE